MSQIRTKNISWDFYSKLIIICFLLLQVLRWRILPQFMDMHYHLLTAWGFNQAGGYSGWDFWQYAPFGRIHIYPPVFHLILAALLKAGINAVILAKICETATPILFLSALWLFVRRNYNERLAFFVLLALSSSYSFYLSLINYIPATLAIILGLYVFDQLFRNRTLRPILLLALCFYTHIGISWFFVLSLFLYGLFDSRYRKTCFLVSMFSIVLACPILLKQLAGFKLFSTASINEKYFSEFKILDYILALFGVAIILRQQKKYWLFLSLFLASFIFLVYPYRFFSAQGYLPIIFLSAVTLDSIFKVIREEKGYFKYYFGISLIAYLLIFSPTILMEKNEDKIVYKFYVADSALVDMVFLERNQRLASLSLWYPSEYMAAANIIKANSEDGDIIYSKINYVGVCLASITGRATANRLFAEIDSAKKFNPIAVSKIFIAPKDEEALTQQRVFDLNKLNFVKIGENKMFVLYKNPSCQAKINIKKASVPFWAVGLVGLVFIALMFTGI